MPLPAAAHSPSALGAIPPAIPGLCPGPRDTWSKKKSRPRTFHLSLKYSGGVALRATGAAPPFAVQSGRFFGSADQRQEAAGAAFDSAVEFEIDERRADIDCPRREIADQLVLGYGGRSKAVEDACVKIYGAGRDLW